MNIKITKVDYQNKTQANELVELLNYYACDPMGGAKALSQHTIDNLAAKLAKLSYAFSFIAYVDNKAVGLINCFEAFSTFNCQPLVNIHDIAVLKDYRNKGIAQAMLKEVEHEAKEKGCCKLTLEVLTGNPTAQAAYKKFGFSQYELAAEAGTAEFWQKKL